MEALAHGVIHKIIRIPPKSVSRAVCHSMSFCIAVDPIPIKAYCAANLMRFAHSERDYFLALLSKVIRAVGDNIILARLRENKYGIPQGGLLGTPVLENLLDAIHLQGQFAYLTGALCRDPSRWWLLDYPLVNIPSSAKSFQSAVLEIFKQGHIVQNMDVELYSKLNVTAVSYTHLTLPTI